MFYKDNSAHDSKGFTVVELIIVIIIIAVLSSIVLSTHHGISIKTRNNERRLDIQYVQTELETYDSQNGHYPSLTDVNNTSWRDKYMAGFNVEKMIDPSSKQTASSAKFNSMPAMSIYSYQVEDSNAGSCESDDTDCSQYTLTATFEGKVNGSSTYVKKNLD